MVSLWTKKLRAYTILNVSLWRQKFYAGIQSFWNIPLRRISKMSLSLMSKIILEILLGNWKLSFHGGLIINILCIMSATSLTPTSSSDLPKNMGTATQAPLHSIFYNKVNYLLRKIWSCHINIYLVHSLSMLLTRNKTSDMTMYFCLLLVEWRESSRLPSDMTRHT